MTTNTVHHHPGPIPSSAAARSYAGKSVLVTGGNGFIGANLTAVLLAAGARVTVADLDCTPSRASALSCQGLLDHPKLRMVELDVLDANALRAEMVRTRHDVIVHLAACSVIERSAMQPHEAIRTNAMGVVTLLSTLLEDDVPVPDSIVTISTDKVYGEAGNEPTDEGAPLGGLGVYEAGKAAGDILARAFHATRGLPVTVLRPCNVYGPHDYGGSRLIPRALSALYAHDEPLPPQLYADSVQHSRDFLYIEDVIEMVLAAGTSSAAIGEVFNLAGKFNAAPAEILDLLVQCAAEWETGFDRTRAQRIRDNGVVVEPSSPPPGTLVISTQRIDGRKLSRTLGVVPVVSIEEGLRRTIAVYRDHYREGRG